MTERQSARMSEIENGRLALYGTKHSKCNHLITLDFKGITSYNDASSLPPAPFVAETSNHCLKLGDNKTV